MGPRQRKGRVRTRSGLDVDALSSSKTPDRGGRVESAPEPVVWTLAVYTAADGTRPYIAFVESLDIYSRRVLDVAVRTVLKVQGHEVCGSEWGKPLGKGLFEFRIRRPLSVLCHAAGIEVPAELRADRKVLLRVFFTVEGERVVLLLCGYDKGADPSPRRQDREIDRARKLLGEHKAAERRRSKGSG